MKKYSTRFLSTLLIATMFFLMAGCSTNKDGDSKKEKDKEETSSSQVAETNNEQDPEAPADSKKKVKTMIEYLTEDGVTTPNLKSEYDIQGNIVTCYIYKDGEFVFYYSHEYEYDNNDNILSDMEYTDDNELYNEIYNVYDDNNKATVTYKLSYESNKTYVELTDYEGNLTTHYVRYSFDDIMGIDYKNFNINDYSSYKTLEYIYKYDEHDNVIEMTRNDGKVTTYDYEYDDNGNVAVKIKTIDNEPEERIEYTYDADGNVLKEVSYQWNIDQFLLYQTIEYTYNENGDMTSFINTSAAGIVSQDSRLEYEYYE